MKVVQVREEAQENGPKWLRFRPDSLYGILKLCPRENPDILKHTRKEHRPAFHIS